MAETLSVAEVAIHLLALERPVSAWTIGLPGTGKSSFLKRLMEMLGENAVVLGSDDARDGLLRAKYPNEKIQPRDPRAFKEITSDDAFTELARLRELAFSAGKIIITDSTGLSRNPESKFRELAIQEHRGLDAATAPDATTIVVAINFQASLGEALAGNELRGGTGGGYVEPNDIKQMHAYREAHALTEFDLVFNVPHYTSQPVY